MKIRRDRAGETAVVTGGSRGIGRAIALQLAEMDVNVVLAARSEESLAETVVSIEERGGTARAVPTDVTVQADIENLFSIAKAEFGVVDMLINSAGIPAPEEPMWELNSETWSEVLDVNLNGTFNCIREALVSDMLERESGTILVLSSLSGLVGLTHTGPYTVSKRGLQGLTSVLASELRGTDIRISNICPGQVDTEMTDDIAKVDRLDPVDVADVATFLLTRPSDAYVPQVVLVPPDSIPLVPQ